MGTDCPYVLYTYYGGIALRVVAFIGPSGTGKSHRASWVARERGIEFIIDDGILIKGNQIIAGSSAKREMTKIASIKRALFVDDKHAEDVKNAFRTYRPDAVLILGTSEGMVEKIVERLELPDISEKVYIHEVASELEIKQALSTRREQGKHVIPVPISDKKRLFRLFFRSFADFQKERERKLPDNRGKVRSKAYVQLPWKIYNI